MALFLDVNVIQYICSCGKWHPLCRLYLCRHCLKLRCGECVLHEVDSPYCPNCLENMPLSEAKQKKNRCNNCFDCPSCGHTLTTRATTQMIPNPDDQAKPTSKKMYYLACGFCRWTTRDVGIADKTVASGSWDNQENPNAARISSLLEYYQQLAQKEKAEKERKKYVRRRSHLMYAASMDKYGLVSAAAKRKSLMTGGPNVIKENEELSIRTMQEVETVSDFPPLLEDIFTETLQLSKQTTISQRHASPAFQPSAAENLYPLHKHFLVRRSLRCKECEHNLSKPEFNPVSIKFKIQLIAPLHVPEIRLVPPPELKFKKDSKVVVIVSNPTNYNTKIQFLQAEEMEGEPVTSKVDVPKKELMLAHRDEASIYDEAGQSQQEFKDDSSVVSFRKANKLGVILKVTPLVTEGNVKMCFILKHNHRNTATTLPSDNQEPPIVWLEQRVMITVGQMTK